MSLVTKIIYIDIESLLDLRYSTIYKFDRALAIKLIDNEYYNSRLVDEFDYITYKHFRLLYNMRDVTTVKESYFTNIITSVLFDIGTLNFNGQYKTNLDPIRLEVNVFPYILTDSRKELLKASIMDKLPLGNLSINIVYFNPLKVHAGSLNEVYYSMFMYDGAKWLETMMNTTNLIDVPLPNVRLHLPMLFDSPNSIGVKHYEQTFKDQATMFKPLVDIVYEPISNYSIKNKDSM